MPGYPTRKLLFGFPVTRTLADAICSESQPALGAAAVVGRQSSWYCPSVEGQQMLSSRRRKYVALGVSYIKSLRSFGRFVYRNARRWYLVGFGNATQRYASAMLCIKGGMYAQVARFAQLEDVVKSSSEGAVRIVLRGVS